MKLTQRTINILKNFSKISERGVYFNAGKIQKAMTGSKSVVVEATLDEDFPKEFGIYDLGKFLTIYSLFNDPEVEFEDKYLQLSENSVSATYWFSSKDMIKNIPPADKSITLKTVDVSFELSKDNLSYLTKSASAMGVTNFVIEGDGKELLLTVRDEDEKTSNKISRKVGETSETFRFVGDIDNLKMMDDDYDVQVSKAGIIQFSSKNSALKYWVAIRK